MVTNINLVSPESEKKPILTGKASLTLAVIFLVIALAVYGAVSYLSGRYLAEKQDLEAQIQNEKSKLSGPNYTTVTDFQERVTLLGKILGNHYYWNDYLKSLSKYVLPEVRLSKFDGDNEKNSASIRGVAPNYDVLARELILLQKFPGVSSVEFQSASEDQSGVQFNLNVVLNKEALKRNLAGGK